MEIRVTAYAKINLTLDVLGMRPDGYHQIESVMQSVNLRDVVTVRQSGTGIAVRCTRPGVPGDQSNTAVKAAKAFFKAASLPEEGLVIEIQKGIPLEAGLAGGSADAAAVLLALNRMYGGALTAEQLSLAALQVGADVPFCLVGGSMRAEGIGEKLTPLPPLPDCYLLLAKPWAGVSTAAAYAAVDQAVGLAHPDTKRLEEALAGGRLEQIAPLCVNLFEGVLRREDVRLLKEEMARYGALGTCMSGSGPTVFGLFAEDAAAKRCRRSLEGRETEVFLCAPVAQGCVVENG